MNTCDQEPAAHGHGRSLEARVKKSTGCWTRVSRGMLVLGGILLAMSAASELAGKVSASNLLAEWSYLVIAGGWVGHVVSATSIRLWCWKRGSGGAPEPGFTDE